MSTSTLVRSPTPGDFEAWSKLWDGYNAFYQRIGPTAVSNEVTELTWNRFFDPDEPVFCLVAETDSGLVGLVHYLFHRNTVMVNSTCYLQDLFTDRMVRGQGIGRSLIETVYDRALEAGSPAVYWHTHKTNQTAMRLYNTVAEDTGFVVYKKLL